MKPNQLNQISAASDQLDNLYKNILEVILNGVWVSDKNNKIIYANPYMESIAGIPKEKLIGKNVLEDFSEETLRYFKPLYEKASKDKKAKFYDALPVITPSGRMTYQSGWLIPKIEKNKFNGMICTIQDTTEIVQQKRKLLELNTTLQDLLKEKEEKYKEIREKYRELFKYMSSGVAVYEAVDGGNDFIFVDFNLAGERIDNLKREEVIGEKVTQLFPGVVDMGLLDVFQRVWKTGLPEHHPVVHYEDKRIRGWRDNYVYKLSSGEIVAVYDDVTEQKIFQQELRENEQKFHELFNQVTDPIVLQAFNKPNGQNEIIDINDTALSLIGYERKDILGKNPKMLNLFGEMDGLQEISNSNAKSRSFIYTSEIVHKSGTRTPVEIKSIYFKLNEKPVILSIARDISHQKRIEEKLKALSRMKSEILHRTSHELKTPLVSIKGFADLIVDNYQSIEPEELLNYVKNIQNSCQSLENLIEEILDAAQLKVDDRVYQKEKYNLSAIIKNVINDFEALIKQRLHVFDLELIEPLYVNIEKKEIWKVFSNLILNAIKYTPQNGTIKIKSQELTNEVKISIEDDGIGITTEERSQLFKQFGKVEHYGNGLDIISEGSGLGLFISRKIVEKHGGKIWVESEGRNKGSTFHVILPR